MDWNFSNTPGSSLGVVAGRIKNSLGLYNDTRDVAFTRPGVFVPQQIYFDSVRNLLLSADGLQLYARRSTDAGNWAFNLGAGTNPVDKNVEYAYLGRDYCKYFLGNRRAESAAFHNTISPLDYEWYLRSV